MKMHVMPTPQLPAASTDTRFRSTATSSISLTLNRSNSFTALYHVLLMCSSKLIPYAFLNAVPNSSAVLRNKARTCHMLSHKCSQSCSRRLLLPHKYCPGIAGCPPVTFPAVGYLVQRRGRVVLHLRVNRIALSQLFQKIWMLFVQVPNHQMYIRGLPPEICCADSCNRQFAASIFTPASGIPHARYSASPRFS